MSRTLKVKKNEMSKKKFIHDQAYEKDFKSSKEKAFHDKACSDSRKNSYKKQIHEIKKKLQTFQFRSETFLSNKFNSII
jgi:hypothetical protein